MRDFERDYRKWSKVALISIVMFLFTIATIDAFLGFDFSKNMYVMSIVVAGCMMALISLTWISILNSKLMRTNLVEPIKPAIQEKVDGGEPITPETIEMCIRKEGYVPQSEDDCISFKIAGERYEVYYQDEKFTLVKRFILSEDTNRSLLMDASSQAQDEIFMFRSYVHTYDNGQSALCFEVETYLSSTVELEKYFPQYLNVLLHAVDRQREIYFQMSEVEQKKAEESTNPAIAEPRVVS